MLIVCVTTIRAMLPFWCFEQQYLEQDKLAELAAWWARKIVSHTRGYRANNPGGLTPATERQRPQTVHP